MKHRLILQVNRIPLPINDPYDWHSISCSQKGLILNHLHLHRNICDIFRLRSCVFSVSFPRNASLCQEPAVICILHNIYAYHPVCIILLAVFSLSLSIYISIFPSHTPSLSIYIYLSLTHTQSVSLSIYPSPTAHTHSRSLSFSIMLYFLLYFLLFLSCMTCPTVIGFNPLYYDIISRLLDLGKSFEM